MHRLIEIYQNIASEDLDVTQRSAAFMSFTNFYGYALKIANEVSGHQGKNRLTVDERTISLMKYSLEDIDPVLDQKATDLFIDTINTYLADKQDLSGISTKRASGVISRVKSLFIMLVATNQYGIIPQLNIPPYMLGTMTTLFDTLHELKESILNEWIDWLKANGNEEMANIVNSVGNDFWGTEGIKPNSIFDKYFGHMRDRINEPIETYNQYLKYRSMYRKSTKDILPSKIYEIFDITPGAYNKGKVNVFNEISELFPGEVAKRLVFEQ